LASYRPIVVVVAVFLLVLSRVDDNIFFFVVIKITIDFNLSWKGLDAMADRCQGLMRP